MHLIPTEFIADGSMATFVDRLMRGAEHITPHPAALSTSMVYIRVTNHSRISQPFFAPHCLLA